jgi:HSP20 family protein
MPGAVTRWEPFAELGKLRSGFDRMFADLIDGERRWTHAIDVERDNGNLVARADVPGNKPEGVEVEDDILTVSGEGEDRDHTERKLIRSSPTVKIP